MEEKMKPMYGIGIYVMPDGTATILNLNDESYESTKETIDTSEMVEVCTYNEFMRILKEDVIANYERLMRVKDTQDAVASILVSDQVRKFIGGIVNEAIGKANLESGEVEITPGADLEGIIIPEKE